MGAFQFFRFSTLSGAGGGLDFLDFLGVLQ